MNGASADPCVNTSSNPSNTNTITIGPSHHFFRTRMNVAASAAEQIPIQRPANVGGNRVPKLLGVE